MKKIRLGRTNMEVSRIGFGGIPIQRLSGDDAVAVVRKSLELGVTYVDTGIRYTNSQERIGKAIAGLKNKPTLATKSFARDKKGMQEHIQVSLKALGVASIDLYQFHNVSDPATYDTILVPGGAMEALQEAKEKGLVKHIGISSHNLDISKKAIKSGKFETLMYPFNFVTNEAADELLPLAKQYDVGFIAMKALAGGRIQTGIPIAFKYLFQFPDIVVLPGIAKISEIQEIANLLEHPALTSVEKRQMQEIRKQLSPMFCRHCDYCLPCPQGIKVSMVMDYEALSKDTPPSEFFTGTRATIFGKAADCDLCGDCETKCHYDMPVGKIISEYGKQYVAAKKKYEKDSAK